MVLWYWVLAWTLDERVIQGILEMEMLVILAIVVLLGLLGERFRQCCLV
jgi:hypothetical protein